MSHSTAPSYHPLSSAESDPDHSPNPNLNSKSNAMGPLQRWLKLLGWRINFILFFTIIISFSFSVVYRFRTPRTPSTELATTSFGQCVPPPGHPTYRYALMIDAGSTGSRIHVYRFSYCLPAGQPGASAVLPTLDHELFFKTQPGLSSYAGRPSDAAESLRPLLQAAAEGVPRALRHCTPIAVKATAGLRLLGVQKSQQILLHIQHWLRSSWPFLLASSNPVSIMDGADEGVYAWVTINYLLKTIGPTTPGKKRDRTAAVMDLGGASTQIVFEPTRTKLEPGEHVYELKFGGQTHWLYQHSHLGYGLMEARRAVHQLIGYSEMWRRKTAWKDVASLGPVGNPCLQPQTSRKVQLVNLAPAPDPQSVTFIGSAQGFDACRSVVALALAKDAVCTLKPCAFAGVYQPSFADAFADGPIYALSYIYDRLNPLGIKTKFKLKGIKKLIEMICVRDRKDDEAFKRAIVGMRKAPGAADEGLEALDEYQILAELDDRPESCLDLTFIYQLLHLGYQIDEDREIFISKKITAIELGWALGAAIDLLEKTPVDQCRAV